MPPEEEEGTGRWSDGVWSWIVFGALLGAFLVVQRIFLPDDAEPGDALFAALAASLGFDATQAQGRGDGRRRVLLGFAIAAAFALMSTLLFRGPFSAVTVVALTGFAGVYWWAADSGEEDD